MRPQTIGRVCGIGVRLTGRMVGRCVMGPEPQAAGQTDAPARSATQTAARVTVQAGRGVAQGASGFWRSLRRVGGIVWLEVSGVFFFLFVLVFARSLWMHKNNWAAGQDHVKFVGSAVLMLVFLYLGMSSFLRARRK